MSEMCGPDDSGEWSGEMSGDVKAATREVKRFEENGHQFHQISKVKAQKKPAFVRRTNFASNAPHGHFGSSIAGCSHVCYSLVSILWTHPGLI